MFTKKSERVILAWGLTALIGWLGTLVFPYIYPESSTAYVLGLWSLLGIIAVLASLKWIMENKVLSGVLSTWLGLIIAGGFVSLMIWTGELEPVEIIDNLYSLLWFVIPSIGFITTSYFTTGRIRDIYATAGILNLVAALILYAGYLPAYPIWGAGLQGIPVLHHWNIERKESSEKMN